MNSFQIGERVSLNKWDKTVPPRSKFGDGVVVKIQEDRNSESGLMLTIENESGSIMLDQNWPEPYENIR